MHVVLFLLQSEISLSASSALDWWRIFIKWMHTHWAESHICPVSTLIFTGKINSKTQTFKPSISAEKKNRKRRWKILLFQWYSHFNTGISVRLQPLHRINKRQILGCSVQEDETVENRALLCWWNIFNSWIINYLLSDTIIHLLKWGNKESRGEKKPTPFWRDDSLFKHG